MSDAKPKHPLAELGPASKNIRELKVEYSNKDTRKEVMPWFWNEFYNDEEWSLWKLNYKYNDELTMTFMSSNLIGGFFARMEGSINYVFGTGAVYGENNKNGIVCAFVIRGQDFKPAFDVAPDWESYEFTKLDSKSEEDRQFIADIWDMPEEPVLINGKKETIVDGKVCK